MAVLLAANFTLAVDFSILKVALPHIGGELGFAISALDEMVALSAEGQFHERFPRLQSLWFAVVDVIAPYVRVSPVQLTRLQRARSRPFPSSQEPHMPLRREAMLVRDALHREIAHPWTLMELADLVRLSPKQFTRVFTFAFGKTPTAYLTILRVQETARLLRETNITATRARVIGCRCPMTYRTTATMGFPTPAGSGSTTTLQSGGPSGSEGS